MSRYTDELIKEYPEEYVTFILEYHKDIADKLRASFYDTRVVAVSKQVFVGSIIKYLKSNDSDWWENSHIHVDCSKENLMELNRN